MAENKTTVVNPPKPAEPKLSLSDVTARDNFIAVALREIVKDQIATKKWNADFAATWAVRYANSVMVQRSTDTQPLKAVMSKGVQVETPLPPIEEVPAKDAGEKTIAELIGEDAAGAKAA